MDNTLRTLERSAKLGGREEVEAYYAALTRIGQEIPLWSAREAGLFGYEIKVKQINFPVGYAKHRAIWNWYRTDGISDGGKGVCSCFHHRKREALVCAFHTWKLNTWLDTKEKRALADVTKKVSERVKTIRDFLKTGKDLKIGSRGRS